MSKAALKKELQKLTKEQIIEQVLDLYEKNKAVKEFYQFYLNPTSGKQLADKYKKLIRKEFNIENPMKSTERFSVAKRVISDFRNLQPSPEDLAEVMLYLPESACELTALYGDYSMQFYDSAFNNYKAALEFLKKNRLLQRFQDKALQCVKWSSCCGYSFADDMKYLYAQYYPE